MLCKGKSRSNPNRCVFVNRKLNLNLHQKHILNNLINNFINSLSDTSQEHRQHPPNCKYALESFWKTHIKRRLTRNWEKPAEVKNLFTFEILGLGASLSLNSARFISREQKGYSFLSHSVYNQNFLDHTYLIFNSHSAFSQDSLQHFKPAGHSLKCKQGCQEALGGLG